MLEIKDIRVVKKRDCCGCGACYNICPVNAITMEWDEEGFYYPGVDTEKCISCGKCVKACPSVHPRYVNATEPDCYAAYTKEPVRDISSSGGVFSLVAEYVLEKGGVVCGAAYEKDFKLSHMVVSDMEGLQKLRGSKYIQSTTGDVYRTLKEHLNNGQPVLFCGCGCQVAGLYGYLQKDYEKLFTIDLMCHGGPSPMVFEKYLQEIHSGKQITHVGFRDKEYFGWSTHMTVKYANGDIYRKYRGQDPFYRAFLPCLSVRPHCQICRFSRLPRQADMTLADFWGIEKYNPQLTDGKGTSILVTNSPKGKEMLEAIRPRLDMLEPVERKYILTHGQPFAKPFRNNPKRSQFMKLVQKFPLVKALECCENDWFDVGIYGTWAAGDYGSILNCFALASVVEDLGYTVLMIEKSGKNEIDTNQLMDHSRRFVDENYAAISKIYMPNELSELNKKCESFLVGGGQIWGHQTTEKAGKSLFLDFPSPYKKRISYAASFGRDASFLEKEERSLVGKLLKKFDYVSVRENEDADILKRTFRIKGTQVLDPVFLNDPEVYEKIGEKSNKKVNERYMLSYILNPTAQIRQTLLNISQAKGLKLINLLDGMPGTFEKNKKLLSLPHTVEDLQVEDWIYYIFHCEFLITDSYYGSSFAILFEKPFVCIEGQERANSEFKTLGKIFQMQERFITDVREIKMCLLEESDYVKTRDILEKERETSAQWLKKALAGKPRLYCRIRYGSKFAFIRVLKKTKAAIPVPIKEKLYPMLKKSGLYMKYGKRL